MQIQRPFLIMLFFAFWISVVVGFVIGPLAINQWKNIGNQQSPANSNTLVTFPNIPVATHSPLINEPSRQDKKLMRIFVTGDVLLARSVNAKMVQQSNFIWPFEFVADKLSQADLVFINLETPLIEDCPVQTEGMIFCGDSRAVEGLQFAGVDVVNIANNHVGNWGVAGVQQTQEVLSSAGIEVVGINQPIIYRVGNSHIAFLGFNEVGTQPGIPSLTEERVSAEIAQAKLQADIVFVQFHWGQEYTYRPTTSQQYWARYAVDSGADVVVGNHPHWWQPLEKYHDKIIVYSHGNFIFDQMWSQETRIGLVSEYVFEDNHLQQLNFYPVIIEDYGQPHWLEGEEKERVLNAFESETKNFSLSQ